MKQVFFTASGQVMVEDVPAPVIEPGRVLVEVTHSLISTGTELASSGGDGIFMKVLRDPGLVLKAIEFARQNGIKATYQLATGTGAQAAFSLGYCAAGRVVDVGEWASGFKVGDRVAVGGYGFANHAEYDVVPVNLAAGVPNDVPLRQACFTTVGAIALQGVRRAVPTLGETVLVIGLGLIGQLTCEILAACGCDVIGMDLRPERVERALAFGATHAFVPSKQNPAERIYDLTSGIGADAVLVCADATSSDPVNQAMACCRKKGRVVLVGAVGMELKRDLMYPKEIDVRISTSYGPGRYDPKYELEGCDYPIGFVRWTENRNMQAFLHLLHKKQVHPDALISIEQPVEQAVEVYQRLAAGSAQDLAAVITYPAAQRDEPGQPGATSIRVAAPTKHKDKVAVGIIGAGGYASAFHIPNFAGHPGADLAAIVSSKGITAKRLAQQHGARIAGTDYREILDEGDIDSVVIATRHDTHVAMACDAAAAGKHVFVEKPIALDRDGLARVIGAVACAKVHLTVGHNRRYSPHALRLKQWRDKCGGPVQMIYTVNAGALPAGHWALDPRLGGGRIIGEACHFFDFLTFLAGADPVEIHAAAIAEPGVDCSLWQNVSCTLRFADGSLGRVDYASRGSTAFPKERVELYAGQGVGVLNDYKRTQFFGVSEKGLKTAVVEKGQREQVAQWIACLSGKPSSTLLGPEAIVGTLTALRAVQSLGRGAPVLVEAQRFFTQAASSSGK